MRVHGYWLVPLMAVSIWVGSVWAGARLRLAFSKYSRAFPRALGFDWRRRLLVSQLLAATLGVAGLGLVLVIFGPLSGLVILGLEGALFTAWLLWTRAREKAALERGLLPWLYGVLGLLQAGFAFHSAVLEMQRKDDRLSEHLGRSFQSFARGLSLEECLNRAAAQCRSARLTAIFGLLTRAQTHGLVLVPLLESCLAELENDLELEARVRGGKHSALAQTAVALAVPWSVFFIGQWINPSGKMPLVWWAGSALALAWQGIGLLAVWKKAEFF